jgi:hypothetical protein
MQFKVRDSFFVHLRNQVFRPQELLELTEEELELVAHQVEPIEAPKPARKAKANGAE